MADVRRTFEVGATPAPRGVGLLTFLYNKGSCGFVNIFVFCFDRGSVIGMSCVTTGNPVPTKGSEIRKEERSDALWPGADDILVQRQAVTHDALACLEYRRPLSQY
jgi:hypothetical protein